MATRQCQAWVPYTGRVDRQLTLNDDFDEYGRLIQTLGTTVSGGVNNQGPTMFGRPYDSPAAETLKAGAVEIWQLFNLTGDTHPIHFHLVNVQVIQRQAFTGDPSTDVTPAWISTRTIPLTPILCKRFI